MTSSIKAMSMLAKRWTRKPSHTKINAHLPKDPPIPFQWQDSSHLLVGTNDCAFFCNGPQ